MSMNRNTSFKTEEDWDQVGVKYVTQDKVFIFHPTNNQSQELSRAPLNVLTPIVIWREAYGKYSPHRTVISRLMGIKDFDSARERAGDLAFAQRAAEMSAWIDTLDPTS